MSNYGSIPATSSSSAYQDPAIPRRPSRTSLSHSVSRSQSQDSSYEGLVAGESNASGGGSGERNVRFVSPRRRGRSASSKMTINGAAAEDADSVAESDVPESSAAHASRGRGVDGNGSEAADEGDGGEGKGGEDGERAPAWAASLRERMTGPTFVLENSGSVARDHLASERTFLAYVRTSLAIASSGVALVQLFTISLTSSSGTRLNSHLQRFARPLGAIVVCMGILLLLVGSIRYFRVQKALMSGKFPPAHKTVIFVSSVLAVLVAVLFGVLVAVPRR